MKNFNFAILMVVGYLAIQYKSTESFNVNYLFLPTSFFIFFLFFYFSDGLEKYNPYQLHTYAQVYHALWWEVKERSLKTKLSGAGKRQRGSNRAFAI